MTPAELDRCITVTAILRPAWPIVSLRSWFGRWITHNRHRTYTDTLHAIVACYTDPKTSTPARLDEAGPWWHAAPGAAPERKITVGTDAVFCPKCRRVMEPPETVMQPFERVEVRHDCNPTSTPEARALAREAAAKAAGEYQRVMGEREVMQALEPTVKAYLQAHEEREANL